MAQLVEETTSDPEVKGSNPAASGTVFLKTWHKGRTEMNID
jgi:hypothetical protein